MNLKQIQNVSLLYVHAFGVNPKIVVSDKNNISFMANFIDYHDGKCWTHYTDSDGDTQTISIDQTENSERLIDFLTEFKKARYIKFAHRWPKWSNAEKLEKIIDFINSYKGELIDINDWPSNIVLLDSNQPLKVILFKPNDEFTVIGMQ
ncbi:hypothetical protein EFN46_08990 [Leuconostoc pseudomesenteroides]|uniref:hypothetical protein n=1 Tax=Leuconostoc pseudomesenteroides TaxID=33968 RepID=UPI0021A9E3CF|nr:hypothetical protein [Leuconostoc pseudomesenteroides]MCT4388334.1 hypothetical protein [Leuconostoc pseudomesenteroides]